MPTARPCGSWCPRSDCPFGRRAAARRPRRRPRPRLPPRTAASVGSDQSRLDRLARPGQAAWPLSLAALAAVRRMGGLRAGSRSPGFAGQLVAGVARSGAEEDPPGTVAASSPVAAKRPGAGLTSGANGSSEAFGGRPGCIGLVLSAGTGERGGQLVQVFLLLGGRSSRPSSPGCRSSLDPADSEGGIAVPGENRIVPAGPAAGVPVAHGAPQVRVITDDRLVRSTSPATSTACQKTVTRSRLPVRRRRSLSQGRKGTAGTQLRSGPLPAARLTACPTMTLQARRRGRKERRGRSKRETGYWIEYTEAEKRQLGIVESVPVDPANTVNVKMDPAMPWRIAKD